MMNGKLMYTFDSNIVSDLHKDAYGFRPSEYFFAEWDACDNDGKQEIWDNLVDALAIEERREREQREAAEASLEKRIAEIMVMCSCARADAIRHLHDAHETNGDREYLEYCLGVRYGYLRN